MTQSANSLVDDMLAAASVALAASLSVDDETARRAALACILAICDRVGGAQEYIPRFPRIDGQRVVAYPDALHRQPDWRSAQTRRIVTSLRADGYKIAQISQTTGLTRRQVYKHLKGARSADPRPADGTSLSLFP